MGPKKDTKASQDHKKDTVEESAAVESVELSLEDTVERAVRRAVETANTELRNEIGNLRKEIVDLRLLIKSSMESVLTDVRTLVEDRVSPIEEKVRDLENATSILSDQEAKHEKEQEIQVSPCYSPSCISAARAVRDPMDRWRGKVALVTGASSGIGRAIALRLATHGMKVVGTARSLDKLEQLANSVPKETGEIIPWKCNLEEESEIMKMFKMIEETFQGVDVCINNAGMAKMAPLLSPVSNTEAWREMLNLNVLAVCICTRESVNQMKNYKNGEGYVINISSMNGHRVTNSPGGGHFYMATKFAINALTQGVNIELHANPKGNFPKIRVTQISPGRCDTPFQRVKPDPGEALLPEDVAESVIYILSQPNHVQVNDILVRATVQL